VRDEPREDITQPVREISAAIVEQVTRVRRRLKSYDAGPAELDAELAEIEDLTRRLERQVASLPTPGGGEPVKVTSSVIEEVAYGYHMPVLTVWFRNGLAYRYFDVPESVYEEFLAAESKGRYFNAYIRDAYEYTEVWWD
jgi:hypothetical protein